MDIPVEKWYPAIRVRHSRRKYDPAKNVPQEILDTIDNVCQQFQPFPAVRTAMVTTGARQVFRGVIGSYGKVTDAPTFLAFIGDMAYPEVQAATGYTAEGIILEATALGLNTCWVGGFFNRQTTSRLVNLKENERILAVSPIGYAKQKQSMEEKILYNRYHRRLAISSLVENCGREILPQWGLECVAAARRAPSAINRQPWGFRLSADGISIFVRTSGPEFNISKRLDCGIAMIHLELGALHQGLRGKWEFLKPPDVARFTLLEPPQ